MDVLKLNNPAFRAYLFYGSILVVKTMAMSLLTSRQRFKNKAVANPEDGVTLKVKPRTDENVERVRRAHLNDLENITVFLFASLGYILTNPSATIAIILIRVFTAARLLHTVVYAIFVVPQPARALAWTVGYAITGYMAVQILLNIHP